MAESNWKKMFTDLKNYIFVKKSWDLARYTFLTFKQNIIKSDLKTVIDCFRSEFDGYMALYNCHQIYKWEKSCKICNRFNTGESCSFSLRFV